MKGEIVKKLKQKISKDKSLGDLIDIFKDLCNPEF